MAIKIRKDDWYNFAGTAAQAADKITKGIVDEKRKEQARADIKDMNEKWIAAGLSQNQANQFGKWLELQPSTVQAEVRGQLALGANIQDIAKKYIGGGSPATPITSSAPTASPTADNLFKSNFPTVTSTPENKLGTPEFNPYKPVDFMGDVKGWDNLKLFPR